MQDQEALGLFDAEEPDGSRPGHGGQDARFKSFRRLDVAQQPACAFDVDRRQ